VITQTIAQLFEACPDEATKTQLGEVTQSWTTEAGTTSELFLGVRETVTRSSASSWCKMWFEFEEAVCRNCNVLTPYELSRLFGLEEQFERSTYSVRNSMTQRLRLDCDFPEAEQRAKEKEARLANMTPQQRKQFDLEQAEQQQRQLQMMQQIMQGQDPWLVAQRAEFRAGKPRKMLDRETLDQLREVVRSRGIDLNADEALTIEANDVEEAIKFARLFSHDRECDLFRGQPMEWNPIASILRLPIEKRGSERWWRFRDWASKQEPLAEIAQDQKKLGAVAQHYGLPTYLLDFSKNPRVAAFFATHTDIPPGDGKACIYCLRSGGLDASYHYAPAFMRYYDILAETERVEVDGLFRMHAQEGSFVCANQEWWTSIFHPDVIRFPRTGPISSPVPGDIYPATKSEIEVLVEEYFANEPDSVKQDRS